MLKHTYYLSLQFALSLEHLLQLPVLFLQKLRLLFQKTEREFQFLTTWLLLEQRNAVGLTFVFELVSIESQNRFFDSKDFFVFQK